MVSLSCPTVPDHFYTWKSLGEHVLLPFYAHVTILQYLLLFGTPSTPTMLGCCWWPPLLPLSLDFYTDPARSLFLWTVAMLLKLTIDAHGCPWMPMDVLRCPWLHNIELCECSPPVLVYLCVLSIVDLHGLIVVLIWTCNYSILTMTHPSLAQSLHTFRQTHIYWVIRCL